MVVYNIYLDKLTWVVYLIGSMIGGRVSFAATDEHDEMDGELIVRVIRLMNVVNELVFSISKSFFLLCLYFKILQWSNLTYINNTLKFNLLKIGVSTSY